MSLSPAQHGKYQFLWRDVCKALGTDPKDEAARLAMHAEHGLPESRTRWGNEEFDVWKRECLAISEPANLDAQIDGQEQPRIRRRHRIRQLLAGLGRNELYLPEVVRRINLNARQKPQITRPFEMMDATELDRVIWELRRDRRQEGGQEWMPLQTAPAAAVVTEDNVPF